MEILLGLLFFGIAVALLSLGTVIFRRPIQGSCGGASRLLGRMGGDESCSVCGRAWDDCPEKERKKVGAG